MNETILRELAERIAHEQFLSQWKIYLLMLALAFVGGALASYLDSYFKKRGENLATKADFNDLLNQLKVNTIATEEIKSKVSHTDWATREHRTIRRTKLEELLQRLHELAEWQDTQRLLVFGDEMSALSSPSTKVELLYILYFPELRIEILEYLNMHKKVMLLLSNTKIKVIESNNNSIIMTKLRSTFATDYVSHYANQIQALALIENRCQVIMGQLISI
jgi:hypothetical protein